MNPIVATRAGKLRGLRGDGVTMFKGVRYAAPPFGVNRLQPPQPVKPWDGVCDALASGPKSPQGSYPPGVAEALSELVGGGEDCLTLNIWTAELGTVPRPSIWTTYATTSTAIGLSLMGFAIWLLAGPRIA